MAEDRSFLVAELESFELGASFVGFDQTATPTATETLSPQGIAVGHWSYSVAFTNAPPLPEITLAWLPGYLPPAIDAFPVTLPANPLGERSCVVDARDATERGPVWVDQDRTIAPDEHTGTLTDDPSVWNYEQTASLADPDDSTGYGLTVVHRPEDIVPDDLDATQFDPVCVAAPQLEPFANYPPPLPIELTHRYCYRPPRTAPDFGSVDVSCGVDAERAALIAGVVTAASDPIEVGQTQWATPEATDALGVSPPCPTFPYSSRWAIYPPPLPIELVFRCSYRRPRLHDQSGPVVLSALYFVDPFGPVLGATHTGTVFTEYGGWSIAPGPDPVPLGPVGVLTDGYESPWISFYERPLAPLETDQFELGPGFRVANFDQTGHVFERDATEFGTASIWLGERFVTLSGVEQLKAGAPTAELADRIITVDGADATLTDSPIVAVPDVAVPDALDSLEFGPLLVAFAVRSVQPPGLSPTGFDAPFIDTDRFVIPDYFTSLLFDRPTVIRYAEAFPATLIATEYAVPAVANSWQFTLPDEVDSAVYGEPAATALNRELTNVEALVQTLWDWPVVTTDLEIRFDAFTFGHAPITLATDVPVAGNVDRPVEPFAVVSFETSDDAFVTRTRAAVLDGLDALQIGPPFVAWYERSVVPVGYVTEQPVTAQYTPTLTNAAAAPLVAGLDGLTLDAPTVIRGERPIAVAGTLGTAFDAPIVGTARSIEVPRSAYADQLETGPCTVLFFEQPIAVEGAATFAMGELAWVRSVLDTIEVRTVEDFHTLFGPWTIVNLDRSLEIPGPTATLQTDPTVFNQDAIAQPLDTASLRVGEIECIWARPVNLYPGGETQTRIDTFPLRIVNESLMPFDQWIGVAGYFSQEEQTDGEIPDPTVHSMAIEPEATDTLIPGAMVVSSNVIGVYEAPELLESGLHSVAAEDRTIEVVSDIAAELQWFQFDLPIMSPLYLWPLAFDGLDRDDNGTVFKPLPFVQHQHQTVLVVPADEQPDHWSGDGRWYYPQFGDPALVYADAQLYLDVPVTESAMFGTPEMIPHEQEVFMTGCGSLETDGITVANDDATIVPTHRTVVIAADAPQTEPGVTTFENLHREIVFIGLAYTLYGNNDPMVHFERGFEVTDTDVAQYGLTFIAPDPQVRLIDTNQNTLANGGESGDEGDYGITIDYDDQHLTPLGRTLEALDWPHVRRARPGEFEKEPCPPWP